MSGNRIILVTVEIMRSLYFALMESTVVFTTRPTLVGPLSKAIEQKYCCRQKGIIL